ncbi:MAG: hypothetical protein ACREDR_00060, partial [Blastocatellia bacterium]
LPLLIVLSYLAAAAVLCGAARSAPIDDSPARISALEAREQALSDRVGELEKDKLDSRLSVMENDVSAMMRLLWTLVGGVALELILHAWRLKAVASLQRAREKEDD